MSKSERIAIARCCFSCDWTGGDDHIEEAAVKVCNIGGGMDNSLSLLEFFALLEKELDVKLNYKKLPWRESDQKVFVADISRAQALLNWKPEVSKEARIRKMLDWVKLL